MRELIVDEPAAEGDIESPPAARYWLHILLFALAFLSSTIVGARLHYNFQHDLPIFGAGEGPAGDAYPLRWVLRNPGELLHGVPFSLCLLAFFLAHEFGHYAYCRKHGVDATLPFFLPFPTLIGMLGAVIKIRAPFRNRRALFDIGVAGPIAGMCVALPLVTVGLMWSKPLMASAYDENLIFGTPLLMRLLMHHRVGLSQIQPHPLLVAGWVGSFATALNLLPSGQLDGGHILYALTPGLQRTLSLVTAVVLVGLGLFCWTGWLVWGAILLLPFFRHPVVPRAPGLSRAQGWVAVLALVIFVLTFHPAPFQGQSAVQLGRDWWHSRK